MKVHHTPCHCLQAMNEVAQRMQLRHPNIATVMGVATEPVTEDPLLVRIAIALTPVSLPLMPVFRELHLLAFTHMQMHALYTAVTVRRALAPGLKVAAAMWFMCFIQTFTCMPCSTIIRGPCSSSSKHSNVHGQQALWLAHAETCSLEQQSAVCFCPVWS